jgi:histidine triad (HIT) family protein
MTTCDFCKIRDGQSPARIVHRSEHVLGFEDTRPQAPAHVLFIPSEHIETANDFSPDDAARIGELFLAATKVAKDRGYAEKGYRLVLNCNRDAGQTVFHVHLHLLAGRHMRWPPG